MDEVRVLDWFVGQVVLEPGRDPFEVFVSLRQHAGLHHDLPDVVEAAGGWQLVQEPMAQRSAVGDETGQQLRVRAFADPLDCGERQGDLGESLDQRLHCAWRAAGVGSQWGEAHPNLAFWLMVCAIRGM